jgi:hypothetical protein
LLDGEITISGIPGKGTTVSVRIPEALNRLTTTVSRPNSGST